MQTESANNILLSGDRQRAEKRCVITDKLIVREIDLQKLILGGHICWESGEGVICCNEEAHRWPWRRNNAGEFVSGDLKRVISFDKLDFAVLTSTYDSAVNELKPAGMEENLLLLMIK